MEFWCSRQKSKWILTPPGGDPLLRRFARSSDVQATLLTSSLLQSFIYNQFNSMPPRPQQNQHGDEGRWTSGIFALLVWQFIWSLLVECYMMFAWVVVSCLSLGYRRSPRPLHEDGYWSQHSVTASVRLTKANSIFISTIILNFPMLAIIWKEMLLWAEDSLSVNRFLVSELGKTMLILPFYVYGAVDFFRASNKWNELSWAFWLLIVIPWVWTIHGSLTSDYVQWTLFFGVDHCYCSEVSIEAMCASERRGKETFACGTWWAGSHRNYDTRGCLTGDCHYQYLVIGGGLRDMESLLP